MASMSRIPASISAETQFYAYILGGIMNLTWNMETMQDPPLKQIVKDFLTYIYGGDEWRKLKVLDAIRDKTRNNIKDETRKKLPSLFAGRAAWPLALPKEAPKAKFEIDFIYKLKQTIEELRRAEETMEEQQTNAGGNVASTDTKAPRLHLPTGTTIEQLTIDNFRALTGRRFRVTTEQQNRITAKTLTRDGAFAEFITELKSENKS